VSESDPAGTPAEGGTPATLDAGELVRVVRGMPDEVELAALVAGILAAASSLAVSEPETATPPPWTDHARRLGAQQLPGPSTWRWSARR
jgi:hypothetical protein